MENSIDAKIAKKMNKSKAGANEVRYPFGNQTETNTKSNDNQKYKDEEDDELAIQGNVVSFDVMNQKSQQNTSVNDAGWEEKEGVVYQEVKEEKKKGPVWGDNVKSNKRAEIPEEEMFFPEIGDEKSQQKKSKQNVSKNAGLFGSSNSGNWGSQNSGLTSGGVQTSNRFGGGDTAIRFSSKNDAGKANKFMQQPGAGPTYDATLGDEETNADQGDQPIQFKGKVKIGTDKTEADIQREKYLEECQQRAEEEAIRAAEEKERRDAQPRFTNSKGTKNAGLFMSGPPQQQSQEEGKRQFTNSSKPKKQVDMGPTLDPSIPTVDKNKGVQVAVTTKGWE